jgi:hypothetical protein
MGAVEAGVMRLVHDGACLLRLIGDGLDGTLKDVAFMPGHDRMLGGTEDGRRGPGGPDLLVARGGREPLYASSELIASPEASSCRQHS